MHKSWMNFCFFAWSLVIGSKIGFHLSPLCLLLSLKKRSTATFILDQRMGLLQVERSHSQIWTQIGEGCSLKCGEGEEPQPARPAESNLMSNGMTSTTDGSHSQPQGPPLNLSFFLRWPFLLNSLQDFKHPGGKDTTIPSMLLSRQ